MAGNVTAVFFIFYNGRREGLFDLIVFHPRIFSQMIFTSHQLLARNRNDRGSNLVYLSRC